MPTSAWGTNYVMIATPPGTASPPGPLWGQILAMTDNTTVQILPSVALPAVGSFPAAPAGMTATLHALGGRVPRVAPALGIERHVRHHRLQQQPRRRLRRQPLLPPPAHARARRRGGARPDPAGLRARQRVRRRPLRHPPRRPRPRGHPVPRRRHGRRHALTYDPPVTGAPATLDRAQVADFTVTGPFHVQSQDAHAPLRHRADHDDGEPPRRLAPRRRRAAQVPP